MWGFRGGQAISSPGQGACSSGDGLSSPLVVGAVTPDHETLIHCLLEMLVVFNVKLQPRSGIRHTLTEADQLHHFVRQEHLGADQLT